MSLVGGLFKKALFAAVASTIEKIDRTDPAHLKGLVADWFDGVDAKKLKSIASKAVEVVGAAVHFVAGDE